MPDIVKYQRNSSGNDYIVGDIHGSNTAFDSVLKTLGDEDRLFLVGDLTDRGPDSIAIIDMIIAKNEGKVPPMIYAVKGNHEEMLLDAINVLLDKDNSNLDKLLTFLYNGGEWIFKNEEDKLKIKSFIEPEFDKSGLKSYVESLIAKENSYDLSVLTRIKEFIEPLPYIIRVGESKQENPFIVCHADLPFNDNVLDAMIFIGADLDDEQKNYLVWARQNNFGNYGRNSNSIRTYVGHNILEYVNDAVRSTTNTINLDFGAYDTGSLVVVNHTSPQVTIHKQPLEKPSREADLQVIARTQIEINKYLIKTMPRGLTDAVIADARADDRTKALATADAVVTKKNLEYLIYLIKNVNQCAIIFSHLSQNGKIKEIYSGVRGVEQLVYGLINKLDEPYRAVALIAIKDQIHEVVNSSLDLALLFRAIPGKYLSATISNFNDGIIPTIIKTPRDLNLFLFELIDQNKKIVALKSLKDNIPKMIHSLDDLKNMLSSMIPEERSIVLASMQDHLVPLIKSEKDLIILRGYFTKPEQESNHYFQLLQKLFDIKKFSVGPNDTKLTACVDLLRTKIKDLDKPGVFEDIDREFSEILESVSSKEVVEVKQIIEKLRSDITPFTINKGGKALEIEQALCSIEPSKRGNVMTDLSNDVQTAILKGRITGKAVAMKNFAVLRDIKGRLQEHKSEKMESAKDLPASHNHGPTGPGK